MTAQAGAEGGIVFNICVPVYNSEAYLEECIRSVLNQTYDRFRLVLVDDGSRDRCAEICDRYAAQDSRITAIHQSNQGQIAARQAALRVMHEQLAERELDGNYVLFLDSDDTFKPHALETIAGKIRETSCDMLIYGIDLVENGRVTGRFRGRRKPFVGTVTDKAQLYQIILGDMRYNSLCRKAIAARLTLGKDCSQYACLRHGEDLLQSLEYLRDTKKAVFIEESLYNYTMNASSMTHSVSAEHYCVNTTVRAAVLAFLESENVWDRDAYREYFAYCRELLRQEVFTISGLRAPMKKRVQLLAELEADAYVRRALESREHGEWLLVLLKSKRYVSVLLLAGAYGTFRRGYRLVRSMAKRR